MVGVGRGGLDIDALPERDHRLPAIAIPDSGYPRDSLRDLALRAAVVQHDEPASGKVPERVVSVAQDLLRLVHPVDKDYVELLVAPYAVEKLVRRQAKELIVEPFGPRPRRRVHAPLFGRVHVGTAAARLHADLEVTAPHRFIEQPAQDFPAPNLSRRHCSTL